MSLDHAAYGLTLRLPFPCPWLLPAASGATPDVVTEYGRVPHSLGGTPIRGPWWQATPGRFLYEPAWGAGRFLIEGGTRVRVEPFVPANERMLSQQFVGMVLAMVMRQRGAVVLHGIAASMNDHAVVVCGRGGAGKSTTLRALLARGWSMLADDYSVLAVHDDGTVDVLPGVPRMHLSEESAARFGVDIEGSLRHPVAPHKVVVETRDQMSRSPTRLAALVELGVHDGADVRKARVTGLEKFAAIRRNFYLPVVTEGDGETFAELATLAERVPVYQLERPVHTWSADQVATAVLQHFDDARGNAP